MQYIKSRSAHVLKQKQTNDLKNRPSLNSGIKMTKKMNNNKHTFQNKMIKNTMKKLSINQKFNGIVLRDSFYNDEDRSYINKSQNLLKTSRTYQAKNISTSTRKRIQTERLEEIIMKKKNSSFCSILSDEEPLTRNKKFASTQEVKKKKIQKLLPFNPSTFTLNKKILQNTITKKLQTNQNATKWNSPFKTKLVLSNPYQGKPLSKIRPNFDYAKDQIKVLNIDKLFKGQKLNLKNIPLPQAEFKLVLDRENMIKNVGRPQTINYVISDFNNLCKINKLLKYKKIGYIQGKTYNQTPSIQQLLGISPSKLKPKIFFQQEQEISQNVFEQYCIFYKNYIRKEKYLKQRFFAGLRCTEKFNLTAYLRFHQVFVSKTASLVKKIEFLQYFFINHETERIQLEMFKLILQLLSEKLPEIKQAKTTNDDILTKDEKCKIFYQTLIKVLVGPYEQKIIESGSLITRDMIRWMLNKSEQSVNLLVALFYDKTD